MLISLPAKTGSLWSLWHIVAAYHRLGANIEVSFPSPACTHLTLALCFMDFDIIFDQSPLGQLSLTPGISAMGATFLFSLTSDARRAGLRVIADWCVFFLFELFWSDLVLFKFRAFFFFDTCKFVSRLTSFNFVYLSFGEIVPFFLSLEVYSRLGGAVTCINLLPTSNIIWETSLEKRRPLQNSPPS